MRHLHHLPLLFLPVNLALADILVFNETMGLPVCAYECKPLWAAQYDCSGLAGGDEVKCFCSKVGWVQGGSGSSGSGWGGCDNACGDWGGGRVKVGEWLGRTCGGGVSSGNNSGGTGATGGTGTGATGSGGTGTGGTGAGTVTVTVTGGGGGGGNRNITGSANGNGTDIDNGQAKSAADQATRARAWWKKNYPFFILAFLVVTVPILCYAFAVPIRKWAKRQVAESRPRRQSNMEELGSGGIGAGGFVFPRSPGGSAVWTAGAPTPGSCGSFMGATAGSGGGGGAGGSRRGSSANALDGPSSSGVFATEVLPPPQDARFTARQESWERRARAQFSRGNGFRLKFWKKRREVDEEG